MKQGVLSEIEDHICVQQGKSGNIMEKHENEEFMNKSNIEMWFSKMKINPVKT